MEEIFELLSRIDMNKLDGEWKKASPENKKEYKSGLTTRLIILIGCGVALMAVMSSAIYAATMNGLQIVDGGTNHKLIAVLALVLATYLLLLGLFIFYYIKKTSAELYSKRALLLRAHRVKGGMMVTFCEKCSDDGVIISSLLSKSGAISLKEDYSLGDYITVMQIEDEYCYITSYGVENGIGSKHVSGGKLQKIEERRLENGNDHRMIEFFIRQTSLGKQLLAIAHRLDIADDKPVRSLDKYYIEECNGKDSNNPKAYSEFVNRILEAVEKDMH